MAEHVPSRRRVAGGLTCVAAGVTALAWGLAGPASAHGDQEPKPPVHGDHDCLSLAEEFGIEQEWTAFGVDDLPDEDFTETYVIDDRGTEDESDDASVTVTVEGVLLEWESTIGIDAVFVKGTNAEKGGYFYVYAETADDEEATGDFHLGVPPWNDSAKNKIAGVEFCYDDEYTPPTTQPTTTTTEAPTTTTEAPTTTTVPPSTAPTTPSTAPPSSEAPTTAPPPTQPVADEELPRTGNNTAPLLAAGGALLAVGVALVVGKRYMQQRVS